MPEHAHVVRVTTFVPADGRTDELAEAVRPIARQASDAGGSFAAQVCEVAEQPGVLAVISRWQRREDLDQFLSEHGDRIRGAVEGLIAEAPTTLHYSALSP
ncbi:MAG: putative quinol monooxygenase [Streptosporangiaceae bacterium]